MTCLTDHFTTVANSHTTDLSHNDSLQSIDLLDCISLSRLVLLIFLENRSTDLVLAKLSRLIDQFQIDLFNSSPQWIVSLQVTDFNSFVVVVLNPTTYGYIN